MNRSLHQWCINMVYLVTVNDTQQHSGTEFKSRISAYQMKCGTNNWIITVFTIFIIHGKSRPKPGYVHNRHNKTDKIIFETDLKSNVFISHSECLNHFIYSIANYKIGNCTIIGIEKSLKNSKKKNGKKYKTTRVIQFERFVLARISFHVLLQSIFYSNYFLLFFQK